MAVDQSGKTVTINSLVREVLGAAGLSKLRLEETIAGGEEVIDELIQLGESAVLVNRIPLWDRGKVIGAVATLRRAHDIQSVG